MHLETFRRYGGTMEYWDIEEVWDTQDKRYRTPRRYEMLRRYGPLRMYPHKRCGILWGTQKRYGSCRKGLWRSIQG